ncbi:MAG: two-component system, NarL family, nitrate/nitrite response regulator NarL [Solirubrobacteraceae bacterium]|nr:two-component system, NarL family, nitrate/nitrite response regulator NarL [Solirubrobacteraceae bacterium]
MSTPRFRRTPSSAPSKVVIYERDPARRLAVAGVIRQSPHLEVVATPRDEPELLAWLQSGEHADVLASGESVRSRRSERYELLDRVRAVRPELPIVYAIGTELPGAVLRAFGEEQLSLVSTRDELARVHEALLTAAAGHRYVSPRLRGILEDSPLTERQMEILNRMARGEGRPEIARALGVSESTVRSHTKELYKRLGVNERAHAVAVAIRDSVIMPPPPSEDG